MQKGGGVGVRRRVLRAVSAASDPRPAWVRSVKIAHAGGGIGGFAYTNSAEAFRQTIEGESGIVELDFMFTSDGVLVCEHGWKRNGRMPMSESEFLAQRIEGCFTPLTAEAAVKMFCECKRKLYLVVDSQEQDMAALHRELVGMFRNHGVRGRLKLRSVVPEFYFPEELTAIRSVYAYRDYAMSLYKQDMESLEDYGRMADFCKDNGVGVLIASRKRLADADAVAEIRKRGLVVATHTLNKKSQVKKYRDLGVEAYFTDFL